MRVDAPSRAGLDPRRLQAAYDLLERWADDGSVPGSAIAVARRGIQVPTRAFGVRCRGERHGAMTPDSVFLVASVTKPVTATAAMQLVERGLLGLDEPVCERIPELTGAGKEQIRLLHLLTHTSGLPDMLPENVALRRQHAALADFVAATCRCGLLFRPGQRVSYQSMGTLLAGELVERAGGRSLAEAMAADLFAPLGMASSSLGIRPDLEARSADVCLPPEQVGTDWHWNTEYWRRLGAPWGGMFATADDLVRFLVAFLEGGRLEGARILGTATALAMVTDASRRLPDLPDAARRRWGLGWRLGDWGDLASPESWSHGGATGTLVGADPRSGLAVAVFTTRPGAPLERVVTAVQAAVVD